MATQTIDSVLQKAYLLAKGKATLPTGNKYNQLLSLADLKTKEWAAEPGVEWNSLYSTVTLGTAGTASEYDLDDDVRYFSKREGDYILLTNGSNTLKYNLVQPNQLNQYQDNQVVAQVGRTLRFPSGFGSSAALGYSITLPVILDVEDVTSGNDDCQVDDPTWLAYAIAAEFVRNDLVKQNQQPYLSNMANELMEKMKQNNAGGYEEISRPWAMDVDSGL